MNEWIVAFLTIGVGGIGLSLMIICVANLIVKWMNH